MIVHFSQTKYHGCYFWSEQTIALGEGSRLPGSGGCDEPKAPEVFYCISDKVELNFYFVNNRGN